jgi:hypothetical protein
MSILEKKGYFCCKKTVKIFAGIKKSSTFALAIERDSEQRNLVR